MPTRPVRSLIEHIRRAATPEGDGELLGRFVESRDENALAALVERHGPMVWGVCRRLVSHHDAEDAFQATFIVLVRKAASVNPRGMVGNWLYGVARQAALQVRGATRRKEVQVAQMPDVEAPQDPWADVRPILDEELSRLPEHYRAVIVLSDLEGRTRRDVAAHLGCPEGTVASRLVRARAMLAKRLTQRGVALSGVALAQNVSAAVPTSAVPAALVSSTIKAASLCGHVSLKVAALTEGVLKTMLLTKLKNVLAILVVAAMIGVLGFGIATAQPKDEPAQKSVEKPKAAKDEAVKAKEAIAWGQEVDGLQIGLALVPADAPIVRQGETVKFAVKLRNVGKAEATVTYSTLQEYAPGVTTDTGGRVSVYMPAPFDYLAAPIKRVIKPGETITLYNPKVAVESEALMRLEGIMRVETPTICVAPGKYKVAYSGMIRSHPKLATGTVEFEVKEPAQQVEAFTEWGKEIGGLQAGLGCKSGQQRAYRHGETVTLVVRVRNVGKAVVRFSYLQPYIEHAPVVTDEAGKPVPQPTRLYEIGARLPGQHELAPGQELALHELKRELKPASESGDKRSRPEGGPHALYGTGKVRVQYEQVFGDPGMGYPGWKLDPTLSKLATGKLELEVKEAPK